MLLYIMQNSIILTLNARMASSPILTAILPILADIFVFTYPLYLIYLYFFTHDEISRWKKIWKRSDDRQHKYQALLILFSFIGVVIVNYIIKFFITEQRPYHTLNLAINPKESLILNTIPTDSFPSDHAAVGMTIAVSLIILWYQQKNTTKVNIWRIFLFFSLIMNFSRITIGIHRPLDIIWGMIIGFCVSLVITNKKIETFINQKISRPLVDFQEWMFSKFQK